MTAEFLEREDDRFEVHTVSSADAALDRLADERVDCVVSDYRMPGMDGLDLLAAVRDRYPDLPFVLFTGEGSETVASDALSAGATEYLQKGSGTGKYALLANRVANAVESYRARRRGVYLERLRGIVHDTNRALVRATTREEVETRVCEIVAGVGPVRFATVSGVDPETGRVEPRTWAGDADGRSEVDAAASGRGDGTGTAHRRAVSEREVAVSTDSTDEDDGTDEVRGGTDDPDGDTLVVPLEYDGTLYGLLTIDTAPARPLDDETRETLAELGDNVAHALDAIETRRDLAESEASYRTLAETASDAIVTVDASSTITYVNPATERLFGYDAEDLVGSSLTRLMPERLRERHVEGVERYLATGDRALDWTGVELPGRHADGSEIPLAISFGEFERHGRQFFTGILRDVTNREERTAELRRQNERLDEFAGIVGHDLRNPLNVASGRVDLARDDCDSDHLDVAARALDRTDDLVCDLLAFARHGQPVGEVEPVDLGAVAADLSVDGDPVAVEVDPALGPVRGHRSRVRALVENLVRNAVEHAGADVTVRIEAIDGGFAVEDDGPGTPVAERDDVFEPGYTSKEGGTGFGLNVVEQVVDAHGWDVAATEGCDGGARFEVTGVEFAR